MSNLSGYELQKRENALRLSIIDSKKVAKNTYEIRFDLKENSFRFATGQYIHVTLPRLTDHDPRGNARDFSISSSPNDKFLAITIRGSDSAFKKTLISGKTKAYITGPFGIFTLPEDPIRPVILIAGGVGITPFMSMMKYATEESLPHNIKLLYTNKDGEGMPYTDILESLQKENKNIKIKKYFPQITANDIKKELPNKEAIFYISGNPAMVYNVQTILESLKISQKWINVELFSGYKEYEKNTESEFQIKPPEHKLAQRSLPDLEALLQALSNSAIVSETNAAGTITFANDKFVEIAKYTRQELIGQNHRILKSGEHSNAYYENMWSTISRGRIWRGVLKNKAKDGTFYWVDSSIAPILGKDGKPVKYISVRFLVSERQQAEEALRESVRQQNVLTILSQEALANTDLHSLFNRTVDLLKKTLNIDLSAVLKLLPGGKSLVYETGTGFNRAEKGKTLVPAENSYSMAGFTLMNNVPTVVTDLTTETRFAGSNLLHDANAVSGVCAVIHGTENPYGILQVYSTKKRMFSGVEIGFIQSVANLLANAVRNQLDKRKDEFLGIASHEIKTPLTSIKTFTQLLDRHAKKINDETAQLFLVKIDQQINKMIDLITDLLDISRINSGKLDFHDETFKIDEIANEAANLVQLITNKHKIILENNVKHEIYGDKTRLGQVLINLLTNAVKYSPGSEKIIVKTYEDGDRAIISVEDFGIGIPENEKDLIFGRFYKGNGRNKHIPGGLGLGLYISSEIIKRHKGKIWVESSEGKGSKFYFSLPLKK